MNPTAYQLSVAASLLADGDRAGADAILALAPDEVADILLGTAVPPRVETFSYRGPFKGERGGTYWLQDGDQDTDDNRVYSPGNPDDGTGGGTDPDRQDISPGVDKAARVLGGATAGGLIGSAVGGPLGMAVGTVAGAALGTDTAKRVLGGIRDLLNRGEEPEGIARKVTSGDPEATSAVREHARGQVRDAAASLAASEPADPAEVRAGWGQASAKMRAGDAAELGGHVEALAGARTPDKVDAAFKAMGGFLAKLVGAPLRLAFGAIKAFGRFALTTGKPYLVWAASLATGAAVLAAPPVALGLGLIGPATAFALAPVAVGGAIGAGMVGRSAQRTAAESVGHTQRFAESADYTPAGPDGKRAVELLATSQAAGVSTLTEVCDRAVRRLLMLPHPEHAAHLFEDDELHRIAGALAGGIATADLLGRSRVRRRAEMAERVAAFAEKDDPGPPGPPPRPGLTWKRETQRWVRRGREHAAELTRRAKEAPAKLKNKVRSYVEKKYAKLAERYGENGAKAVMAASLLLLPVPVPGASFVPIALAEAVRAVGKGAKAVGFAEGEAASEDWVEAVIEFLTELYAEAGEELPAIDPERVRAALERDEVDEDEVETFAEWTRYDGPEGGKGWRNAAGEVRYQVEMPGTEGAGAAGATPKPAGERQVVGEGNTGKVYRDGNEVVKAVRRPDGTETREGEFFDALRGVEGIAPGRRVGDEIRLPHYQEILSIDAVPDERDRKSMGSVVGAQKVRLLNAVNAMSAAGIDYNDPIQVGFDDDYKAHLIDLSNAGRVDPKVALSANVERLVRFLNDFGAEQTAQDISRTFSTYNTARMFAAGSAENIQKRIDNLVARGNTKAVEHIQSIGAKNLAGYDVQNVYYANNPRPVERPGILQSQPDGDGLKVILSNKPLDADTIRQYQLTPVVHPAAREPKAATFAESPPTDPWHDFAEPVPAVEPAAAVDYFRRLVPTLADDPGRYGLALGRHAFTLAVATEQTILQKVKDAILAGLRGGVDATADVQDVLDAAGVSPKNPQTAEMIWRTNAMDALNNGAQAEIASPEMQEAFPVIRYDGILDSRTGDDHRPHIGRYYPASRSFADIRGPRVYNCRCSFTPIHRSEAADLIRAGKVERG